MPKQEKGKVLQAIRDLGRRVTAADVATKTGLPILIVTSELNNIAADAGGHLEVATTGDIAYSFAPGFQNVYLARGVNRVLQQIGSTTFQIGFYLLRISFGIMLILSLLAIAILFMILILRGSSSRDSGRIRFHFGFFDYLVLRDLLYWGAYAAYPVPSNQRAQRRQGNFLLSCFSFLFGDGNPNADLEERKWQLIAQVIRSCRGVVTSEQLAAYTGADPGNEDGVLPVLVRFNGRPEVTDSGNIVYVFPSLQVSAAGSYAGSVPEFLREYPWRFSNAPAGDLVPVYILAGVNFFGSWWLFLQAASSPVLAPLAPLIFVLVAYGTFFVGLPLARWLVLQSLNARIESRNQRRQSYARMLEDPPQALLAKLAEARQYQVKEQLISADKVVYTTDKDALEQEFREDLGEAKDEVIKQETLNFEPGSEG